ncbi:MAG: homocysteine S-methyltransferase family protein [Lentisphaerota bacterium]
MSFREMINNRKLAIFDGAMGTELASMGLEMGGQNNITNPDKVRLVHQKCLDAGADVIITNTLTMNSVYTEAHSIDIDLKKVNIEGARIAKGAGRGHFVVGDIGSTGQMLEPYGLYTASQLIDAYAEQAQYLLDGGVDGFLIETMMDMNEALCALKACKNVSDLPVIVSMSYMSLENGCRTIMGHSASECAKLLEANGADMIASNCGDIDPFQTVELVKIYQKASKLPILVQPNAGRPKLVNGKTLFDMSPETFAIGVKQCLEQGALMAGGCCGTTPDHIRALSVLAKG